MGVLRYVDLKTKVLVGKRPNNRKTIAMAPESRAVIPAIVVVVVGVIVQ